MGDALIVSNVLLWIAVVALGVLVLALLRQIGVLHERIGPAGALVGREGPRAGEPAPVLDVADWEGRSVRVGGRDPAGRGTLLLFVSPTCPLCETLLPLVASVRDAEDRALRVLVASDGPRREHEAFVARHGLARAGYLLSTPLGLAFEVGRLPYAVLIDGDGVIRARGLVNSREHLESLFEARARGVASMQEYFEGGGDRRVA